MGVVNHQLDDFGVLNLKKAPHRKKKEGVMPEKQGWFYEKIGDKVILVMVRVRGGNSLTRKKEFPSVTAMKAWCKTHFPVKFPKKKTDADAN